MSTNTSRPIAVWIICVWIALQVLLASWMAVRLHYFDQVTQGVISVPAALLNLLFLLIYIAAAVCLFRMRKAAPFLFAVWLLRSLWQLLEVGFKLPGLSFVSIAISATICGYAFWLLWKGRLR